ncbi:MAG: winged helix-turn-helix transcriptional regulator [Candidatus Thorarchaeota archaeon]
MQLDKTDVAIIKTLNENSKGSKISTKELSEILGISDRTARYRLKRLKEKGFFKKTTVRTYERKIGVGDMIILVQSNPEKHAQLGEILYAIPPFYHFSPTYGKYNGYWIFAQYPLSTPQMCKRLIEELKTEGLIEDYILLDAIDYDVKGSDVEAFLKDSTWEWSDWYEAIKTTMEEGKETDWGFNEFPNQESFDFKDLQIIKKLVQDAEITLKDLGEFLELSQPQVHKRVKRLEEIGVITGYKPSFMPFKEYITVACVFESRDNAKKILQAFSDLPFALNIGMQSSIHYNILTYLPPSEVAHFLKGVDQLRQHAERYFVQFSLDGRSTGYAHLFDTFVKETNNWEMPVQEYLDMIKDMAKKEYEELVQETSSGQVEST